MDHNEPEEPNDATGIVQSNNAVASLSFVGPSSAPTTTASLSCLAENLTLCDEIERPKEQRISKKRKTSSTERRLRKEKKAGSLLVQTKQPTITAALSVQGSSNTSGSPPLPDANTATATNTAAIPTQRSTIAPGSHPTAATSTQFPAEEEPVSAAELCGYQAPPRDLRIPHNAESHQSQVNLDMTSPLTRTTAETPAPSVTFQYSYSTVVGRRAEAPRTNSTPPAAYKTTVSDQIQTSRQNISFRKQDGEPDFSIMPEANDIWRKARTCFITAEKIRFRSDRLQSWAKQRLVPDCAVGTGPIPPQFTCTNSIFNNRLGEKNSLMKLRPHVSVS